MLVWLFWNIGYLLGKVGILFFLSLLCVIVLVLVDQCRLLSRLVYTIDFNELT